MKFSQREQFDFVTARIEANKAGNVSNGTGFFYRFHVGGGYTDCLITNRHVLEGATSVKVTLRSQTANVVNKSHFISVDFKLDPGGTVFHSDPQIDLAAIGVSVLQEHYKSQNTAPFWVPIDESETIKSAEQASIGPMQRIITIGYPIGLKDEVNNTPFYRGGITATSPANKFNGANEFIIDSTVFPGSSGSPVLVYDVGIWTDEHFNSHIGETRVKLLGIVRAVYEFNKQGQIAETSCESVPIMGIPTGLGICINASELDDLNQQIQAQAKGVP